MIKGTILDLDGTLYWGKDEVPGAGSFVNYLEERGMQRLFLTNRSNRSTERICDQLRKFGIRCDESQVLTSAQATADYLQSGTFFCIGEQNLIDTLEAGGLRFREEHPDYVIVSFDRDVTYQKIEKACRFIEAGADFIATNPDKCLRSDRGLLPGTGALVAAVAAGSGVEPLVIGKPEKRIVEAGMEMMGTASEETVMIGDNLKTDIPAGSRAGVQTVLLLTGVSRREEVQSHNPKPDWVIEDFAELRALFDSEFC